MTAVVDASVLIAGLVAASRDGPWARSVIARYRLAAPEHVLVETCSVLRRMEQAGTISGLEATSAFRALLGFDLRLFPFAPLAKRIWALRANLTSYDAWYVALAEQLSCPLLTLDRRVGRATGPSCEIITPRSEVPELLVHQSTPGTTGW